MTQPYPRYYELKICPVCREQVEEDYEYGTYHSHKGYHGDIEPVLIRIAVPESVEQAVKLAQPGLEEKRAKQERWDAQLDWWLSLPQDERDRREAERRAAMSPMERALEDSIRGMAEDSRRMRQLFSVTQPINVVVSTGTAKPTTKEGE